MIRNWWHRHTHKTCRICETEFRKHKASFPSLVGFSYCSAACEARAWDAWIKGASA